MIVGGVDEAGRGCVIGPLVVAGVSIEEDATKALTEIGVKDSKVLRPKVRTALYGEILKLSSAALPLHIYPAEIDEYVKKGKKYRKLNYLEARYMAKIIDQLGAEKVYVDAADTNPERFGGEIADLLAVKRKIISQHYADRNHVVVAAASIIAKVERDRAVESLRDRYGDFGSGYPSDYRTMTFLERWLDREGAMPDFTRKSWRSWDRLLQLKL